MSKKPILILQMQRMGDLILSYPLMLWLARRHPGHPIFVAAEKTFYEPLMKLSPPATYFPWAGTGVLKQHEYALIINLSIQEKAAVLAGQLQAEEKLGQVQAADGSRFVHGNWQLYRTSLVKNNLFNRYHWAELNGLDAIPFTDISATRFSPPRVLSDSNKVGLFLGASDAAKRPSATFWAALVDELHGRNLRPVLFGGPKEKDLGAEVARLAKGPALNLCGTLDLSEFSAVGQTLALFITPDTGPMHLAAWTGLKCLNLSMGNVNPWETGPVSPGHFVLRADLECAKGCWQCTQDSLLCHDPFKPGRIAALAARMAASSDSGKLAKMDLPGLTLFQTGKSDTGLYQLKRLDRQPPDQERYASRFWQAYFGHLFGLWPEGKAVAAWDDLARNCPEAAESLLRHLPEMTRQFKHGLLSGSLLDTTFWTDSPVLVKPLTGYVHMYLENSDYARTAWVRALKLLERLAAFCR
ncbi:MULTISPECIES: glycosyltransferase family 9 protein [unclassified Pseudodesulfovibrio]|uniref:glycosyltransferase family 9 protein n=1 Tax=unclassified Pseudodesulfovibrio TaxID=2661612 RepID=UPI000FEBDBD8|nr:MULTISPECIES: glycosyltransferase family 9 protein [unclassified Pseudodesulfovibrio]MCJ2166255.1 glycosyltransferase family 9 protein [Pseudodesulfovibrio sp. S3-i]RWU02287.1 glycosyltransferase family 9 protein [Pseudodesulfovibrio sp. S3]